MKTILYMDADNDYFGTALLSGFVQESKNKQWWNTLRLAMTEDVDHATARLFEDVDGFVTRGVSGEVLERIKALGKPHLVLRSATSPEGTDAPHVDDGEIGRIALAEINGLNLPNRAFLGYSDVVWSDARREAFTQSVPVDSELLLQPDFGQPAVNLIAVRDWLISLPKPVAIFAASDQLANKVTQAALMADIKVPHSVAVIGVDNDTNLCDHSVVTLSSIDLHADAIGRKCAWVLAKEMKCIDDFAGQPLLRKPDLVIRESSHQVDKHFVIYKSAISWINRHALVGPSVDEVADACAVSRRSLERIFGNIAKSSPASVIREKRVSAIMYLLSRDDVSLGNLSQQAGFSSLSSFSNFIYRNAGKSPSEIKRVG